MRIFFFLLIPLFLLSQEKKYEKTLSVSQFIKELKEAEKDGINYELKNALISFDPVADSKYAVIAEDGEFYQDVEITDLKISDSINIKIENCLFGKRSNFSYPTILFKGCEFGSIDWINNSVKISFDSIQAKKIAFSQKKDSITYVNSFSIKNSDIKNLRFFGEDFNKSTNKIKDIENFKYLMFCQVLNNNIGSLQIEGDFTGSVFVKENSIEYMRVRANLIALLIKNNKFNLSFQHVLQPMEQLDSNTFKLNNRGGLSIVESEIYRFEHYLNSYYNLNYNHLNNDTLVRILSKIPKGFTNYLYDPLFSSKFNHWWKKADGRMNDAYFQYLSSDKALPLLQIKILEDQQQNNDSLKILYNKKAWIFINESKINKATIYNDSLSSLRVSKNNINDFLKMKNLYVDSDIQFYQNTLPEYHTVQIDSSVIEKLAFSIEKKIYYGNETYTDLKDLPNIQKYINGIEKKASQLKQFLAIFNATTSSQEQTCIYILNDIQKNKKMCEYFQNPSTASWFNWKGSQFLKWYSDYGMNPFKALSYCFKVMLYFAIFYFFFSNWDTINRSILIRRFNRVIDYFTSEKKIEDFYTSQHDEEMSTFKDFKSTLDTNKIHMPFILAYIARPIYQFSFFRYNFLKFFYKKIEFMAGRKWKDLPLKERYGVGALTVFLSVFYIFSLIVVRSLNSITLSINAFSTLGFGVIPVRGFTKYVAILQGFIGWFLLSVFLVSLLNQMMTI